LADEILDLVRRHEQWRGKNCINLIPSENVMSPAVRSLLSSDLGHRYTSRDGFYMGTRFLDEVEQCGVRLAKEVFRADTADLRPLSGHIADMTFLATFTEPKDTMICVSPENGGYPGMWKQAIPKYLKLKTRSFPFSKRKMNIEVDAATDLILQEKPKVIVFGASLILFPQPVRELAKAANEVETLVAYDGSHVLGLIAGGEFQSPLQEGASALFGSTHKTFFGPQGGIILADKEHGEAIEKRIYPAFVDNAHWNRIAALSLALAEMKKYGRRYARQVILNAETLAKALADYGFPVACPDLGYTRSHQVFLDYGGYKQGRVIAEKLERADIIADCGVRLGACEITRRGMKAEDMDTIAELMKRAIVDKEDPSHVERDVAKLTKGFERIEYCLS
jgi:glycine hydroxymethyltransferase